MLIPQYGKCFHTLKESIVDHNNCLVSNSVDVDVIPLNDQPLCNIILHLLFGYG